ncbi:SPOR domain-containing protein [Devosia albogilva]|uniref:SPOR domain-containing protein n=1 Tax=Devosia albogilva TaxID=429726 RepID=A0ABW5QPW6_9HYPH
MAKASEQFRQSDVTLWGIVALVMGAVAVLGANVSALLPQDTLASLHKSRLQGPTLEQLRGQVAELREQTVVLKRENSVLAARFALNEQQGSDVLRRVGALEVSMPKLLEAVPDSVLIDRSNVTAGIGQEPATVYPAEGGTVVVRQRPMPQASVPQNAQPLPALPAEVAALPPPNDRPHGVAIGPSVTAEEAAATWQDLTLKLGPVLFGLSPALAGEGERQRIVVGPIAELAEASALCQRLERVAIACTPQPYDGVPLAVE